MNITVLGSGGWGTALAMVLFENGNAVTMWTHSAEECRRLRRERSNPKLLPGVTIPESIRITDKLTDAADSEMVIMAVPSFAVYSTALKLAEVIKPGAIVVNVAKGLDRDNGYCRFSQSIDKALGGKNPVVALTGPTHAEEVARFIPTTILAASKDQKAAEMVQDVFMSERFRVYVSGDIIGAELGGAFKNIIALAVGVLDGMGYGDNTKAALMTRGLTEIARLGISLGANSETFAGLSGVGDLIVTCTSMHSRNRRAGILIGQGKDVPTAMREVGAVVEGYYATESGYRLAQKTGVEMPIITATYAVLYQGADPTAAAKQLMTRSKKHETEDVWL